MGNLSGTTASDCPHSNDGWQCNQASLFHRGRASHELELNNKPLIHVQNSKRSIRKSPKRYWLVATDSQPCKCYQRSKSNIQTLGLAALVQNPEEIQLWGVPPQPLSHALWSIWSKVLKMGLPLPSPNPLIDDDHGVPWWSMELPGLPLPGLQRCSQRISRRFRHVSFSNHPHTKFGISRSCHWHAEVHPTGRSTENYGDDENVPPISLMGVHPLMN